MYVRFRFGLSRFEDSAEFPSCISYVVSAYIKTYLSFPPLFCAIVERSSEIVVRLRVGTHCAVSPVAPRVPRIRGVTKVVSEP